LKKTFADNLLTPIDSFGCFNKRNERIDSEKDSFILMNEFEQKSHRTEQFVSI